MQISEAGIPGKGKNPPNISKIKVPKAKISSSLVMTRLWAVGSSRKKKKMVVFVYGTSAI